MNTCGRARITAALHAVPAPVVTSLRRVPIVAPLIRALVNPLLPREPTAVRVRSGFGAGLHLVIDPQTEKFLWAGDHELAVQRELAATLRPGMVVWDVGAHAGFFTVIASRLVGEEGKVHAFEPMASTRARLEQSVALSGRANVTVHDCAVSSASGKATLYENRLSPCASLLPERAGSAGWEVRCTTIDELASDLGDPNVVKIDVEGVEFDILCGGHDLLGRRTASVIVEFSNGDVLSEARRLLPDHEFRQLDGAHWVLR